MWWTPLISYIFFVGFEVRIFYYFLSFFVEIFGFNAEDIIDRPFTGENDNEYNLTQMVTTSQIEVPFLIECREANFTDSDLKILNVTQVRYLYKTSGHVRLYQRSLFI